MFLVSNMAVELTKLHLSKLDVVFYQSGFRDTAYRDQQLRSGFWAGPQQDAERKDARYVIRSHFFLLAYSNSNIIPLLTPHCLGFVK